MNAMQPLIDELKWRGLLHQCTHDDLGDILEKGPQTVYAGFDPTADSLHVGSLLPIIGLMHFQRHGHRPIALLGGGTGMIGDPSGKSEERQLLDDEALRTNVAGIRVQLEQFLDFDGDRAAILLNNADWLASFTLVEFLRDIGKHFSVNAMLMKDSVRTRLEDRDHGISFTEFSYSLLQASDFLQLYRDHGCQVQIGGSDQWGNIVAGMDLIRRKEQADAYGLTFPLVEKADGTKFGKSESGTIWLNAVRTSPYHFYQFWLNQSDADVSRWLRAFTFLPKDEIESLEQSLADAPHERVAHRKLAEEVTRMVHGDDALQNAVRASKAMFGGDLQGLDDATLEDVFSEVPSSVRPRNELTDGRAVLDVLVECEVFKSKGEARRMIDSGGVYLNNERIALDAKLGSDSLVSEHIAVVRKGKKNYHLLRFE
jgi:tyrosyl-tRNA synthetase